MLGLLRRLEMHPPRCVTNATDKKKRFIEALTAQGTVYHAALAAGVSRQTAYRWRHEDSDFADRWDEAHENSIDAVENTIFQQAVGGNTLAAIFYLKAHDLLPQSPPSDLSR